MNLVRLGMIVALAVIAWYSLSIYAALPPDPLPVIQRVEAVCASSKGGIGPIIVACLAIGGALSVSAVDLMRRVY